MIVGIPKEILANERRVALTPETAAMLTARGIEVVVQAGAGAGILVPDAAYAQVGATVLPTAGAVYDRADVIVKVKQPEFNLAEGRHEAEMMKPGSVLVSFLHPAAPSSHELVRTLARRNVTSFTMDAIPRTSRAQAMDALTSMSTVTGYRSVLLAAMLLPRFVPMLATAIGTVKPARYLVVGAGVVGLQAIATAKRLGAPVDVVDIRPEARENARSLGAKVEGFDVPPDLAKGSGGYARALSAEWLEAEVAHLAPLVAQADVVILSALVPGEVAPILVPKALVEKMKPGSVIVDVAIDQGGNCAATDPGKTVTFNDVTVVGTQNIPGSMPVHASWLYANNVVNYLQNLFKGRETPDWDDEIVKESCVTREGRIVHEGTLKSMQAL